MIIALFWIVALICTVVATVGAIASTEPTAAARSMGSDAEPDAAAAR